MLIQQNEKYFRMGYATIVLYTQFATSIYVGSLNNYILSKHILRILHLLKWNQIIITALRLHDIIPVSQ